MDSNKGFPLVTVQRNYDNQTITLSEKQYFKNKGMQSDTIWYIPVSYVYELSPDRNFSDTTAGIWLTKKDMTVADEYKANGWFLINKQQAARRGEISYHVPLNLSKYISKEMAYVPIDAFVQCLDDLDLVMSSSKLYDVYQNYVIGLLSSVYDSVGKDALERLHEWRETGVLPILDELKYTMLCQSLRNADIDDWEFVYKIVINDSETTYSIYYSVLSCSENESILN
ncbi:hypothetical protein ILUMI_17094, partial [Ignelater luminosus]